MVLNPKNSFVDDFIVLVLGNGFRWLTLLAICLGGASVLTSIVSFTVVAQICFVLLLGVGSLAFGIFLVTGPRGYGSFLNQ